MLQVVPHNSAHRFPARSKGTIDSKAGVKMLSLLVAFLIFLLVVCVIAWLVTWILSNIPGAPPAAARVWAIAGIVILIWVIQRALPAFGVH
jgi:hypothetical protein